MRPSGPCHGYSHYAKWHVGGWLVGPSHIGACLWKEVCCEGGFLGNVLRACQDVVVRVFEAI